MKKVFVLVIDWTIDHDHAQSVHVFNTLSQAQEYMSNDIKKFKAESSFPEQVEYDSKDNMSYIIQEEGYYSGNHCDWSIYEREVEPDKEKQS